MKPSHNSLLSKHSGMIIILVIVAVSTLIFQTHPNKWLFHINLNATEPWRYFTAHYVHLNWQHWTVNLAGLCLLPFLISRIHLNLLIILLLVLPFCISFSFNQLANIEPITAYVGLSGVLHGLFIGLALLSLAIQYRTHNKIDWLDLSLIILIIVKIILERMSLFSFGETVSFGNVYSPAHFFGALWGSIVSIIFFSLIAIHHKKRE